jgi:hypothetical protein
MYYLGHFDVAQICLNRHLINYYAKGDSFLNKDFCSTCGEKTITQCQSCGHEIRGEYSVSSWQEHDVYSGGLFNCPSYCEKSLDNEEGLSFVDEHLFDS